MRKPVSASTKLTAISVSFTKVEGLGTGGAVGVVFGSCTELIILSNVCAALTVTSIKLRLKLLLSLVVVVVEVEATGW